MNTPMPGEPDCMYIVYTHAHLVSGDTSFLDMSAFVLIALKKKRKRENEPIIVVRHPFPQTDT